MFHVYTQNNENLILNLIIMFLIQYLYLFYHYFLEKVNYLNFQVKILSFFDQKI